MNYTSFTEILTSLYNGNRGEAQRAAEVVRYDNTFNLLEEYDRRRQRRLNYEALKNKQKEIIISIINSTKTT